MLGGGGGGGDGERRRNRFSKNGADYAFGYRVGLELLCEGHSFCQTPQDRTSALHVINTVTPPLTSEMIFFPCLQAYQDTLALTGSSFGSLNWSPSGFFFQSFFFLSFFPSSSVFFLKISAYCSSSSAY